MAVRIEGVVDVVSSITTGSSREVQHPETLVLHYLGVKRLEHLVLRLERREVPEDRWKEWEALKAEESAVYPMILEPCSDELAAKRCEWYAKVLRATAAMDMKTVTLRCLLDDYNGMRVTYSENAPMKTVGGDYRLDATVEEDFGRWKKGDAVEVSVKWIT